MKCEEITDMIFIYDELPEADRQRVDRHLSGCPECRKQAEAMQVTMNIIHQSASRKPVVGNAARLTVNIMASVRAEGSKSSGWRLPDSYFFRAFMAACSIFLIAVFVAQVRLPTPSPAIEVSSKHSVSLNTVSTLKELRERTFKKNEPTSWYACARSIDECDHALIEKIKNRTKK